MRIAAEAFIDVAAELLVADLPLIRTAVEFSGGRSCAPFAAGLQRRMPDMLPIYLIGPRACGKTTVGRQLAARLGRDFVDTDELLLVRIGSSIADFVATHGWEAFRDEESAVLELLAGDEAAGRRVVSCGGGIVLRPRNRELLAGGRTIYLHAAPETLVERLTAAPLEGQRPSLTGKSAVEEVREVLAAREPLYREAAHAVLDGCAPPEEVVRLARSALASIEDVAAVSNVKGV